VGPLSLALTVSVVAPLLFPELETCGWPRQIGILPTLVGPFDLRAVDACSVVLLTSVADGAVRL
jgi:hypothetical protein